MSPRPARHGTDRSARTTSTAQAAAARPQLGEERWATIVVSLEQIRDADGALRKAVEDVARRWEVAPSTVWARLKRGRDGQARPPRPRYQFGADDRRDYIAARGNVAAMERRRGPAAVVSRRTVQRAAARDLRAIERVYATKGWRSARELLLFRQGAPAHRNAVWETDHKQLGVTVVFPDGTVGKPWVTLFIDLATRIILGWAIDLVATGTTVTCALRRALAPTSFPQRPGEPSGDYGGVPLTLRRDNGLEFVAAALVAAIDEFAITEEACPPYTPHLKGTVERLNYTIDTTLLAELPHYSGGPRKADGSLYAAAGSMLSLQQLVEEFATWVEAYHDRPHEGLHGLTPRQAWLADPTPLRWPAPEQLRGLLHREDRRIGKLGIRLNNVYYLAPKLMGMRGKVQIRYDKHAPTELLVYIDGQYADTAFPQDTATPEQLQAFRSERATLVKQMKGDRVRATRVMRTRIRPATGPGPVQDGSVVPADAGRGTRHPTQNPAARARARLTLRGAEVSASHEHEH